MTPPPPHNCVFGGTPLKTKNAAPLPLPCGKRPGKERSAGREECMRKVALRLLPSSTPPIPNPYPYHNIHPVREKVKGRRDARLTSEDSVPITPAQSRASMNSHPCHTIHPVPQKVKGADAAGVLCGNSSQVFRPHTAFASFAAAYEQYTPAPAESQARHFHGKNGGVA